MSSNDREGPRTRRDELLLISLEVLERDGSENLSVGEIARQAGIKTPSLYKQFDGKADIQKQLIDYGNILAAENFVTALANVDAEADYRERLAIFARTYREFGLQHPQLYRLMHDHELLRPTVNYGIERAESDRYIGIFPNNLIARSFWSWAHGLMAIELAQRFPDGGPTVDELWDKLVDTVAGMTD